MRHIITGGSGFTGTHLASALIQRDEKPVIFDLEEPKAANGSIEFVRGDIREPRDLEKIRFGAEDVVYHLAARQFHFGVPHRDRDAWFADVNVNGTRCLLAAMSAGTARRIIFFSTDMTYGIPGETPIPPSHPQQPIGPYGRSKVQAERLLAQARTDFSLKATIFRPRLISGAGRLGILTKLFRLIQAGLPVPLIGAGRKSLSVDSCGGLRRCCACGRAQGLPRRAIQPWL